MKKPYRAVLVGCGGMSGAWLTPLRDYFSDRVEMVGLVDLFPEAAVRRAQEFGLAGIHTGPSLESALEATRPDLVFNCTIPEAHFATCATALRAGCHVLEEKPLAANLAEGRQLRDLAAAVGRTLAVIQNRRYLAAAVAARQALRDGVIGRVNALYVDFFLGPRFGGFRETMQHPLLLDMAIHTFDQSRFLAGLNARRVFCQEFNPAGSWYSNGASATASFEMAGGAFFSYRGSWCARGFPTAWAGDWRILGEKGTLRWDGEGKIEVERIDGTWDGKSFFEPVEKISISPAPLEKRQLEHAGNIGEFLDALDAGISPQTAAADNLHSMAMVEAAIASSEKGEPVILADDE